MSLYKEKGQVLSKRGTIYPTGGNTGVTKNKGAYGVSRAAKIKNIGGFSLLILSSRPGCQPERVWKAYNKTGVKQTFDTSRQRSRTYKQGDVNGGAIITTI